MRESLVLRREVARLDNDIRKDWCGGSLENAIGHQQVARRLGKDSSCMVYHNLHNLHTFIFA